MLFLHRKGHPAEVTLLVFKFEQHPGASVLHEFQPPAAALFEGEVADVITRERVENRHEQTDSRGRLELVENRRTWMLLELEDEEGYLGRVAFPMEKKHQSIRRGSLIRCLVLSERKDFTKIGALSDAWLPGMRMWVGEYPFLLRPAFEELCQLRLSSRR